MSQKVFVVSAKRTPFGTFGGTFKNRSAIQLAVDAAQAALDQAGRPPVDHVFMGNVQQTSADAPYLARHVGLKAGLPIEVPALTVNRLCGSGFQALINGVEQILLGHAEVCLTGGTENMSQAPHAVYSARWGASLGTSPEFTDTLWAALTDSHCQTPMGITAENLAEDYGVSREEADIYSLRSQTAWAAAQERGLFAEEIVPVEVPSKKGPLKVEVDEHPRTTSLEKLSALKPVFKKEGRVTAGSASGICDGAAALVVASEQACAKHGLTPLAEVVSWATAGVDPTRMGIGPAPAVRRALERAQTPLSDVVRVEVNEAFSAQVLAVEKELGLDRERTNVNGGAIALGHPLGASGARIAGHLVYELRRVGGGTAVGSACIGGGQGIAVVLRSV
ncbi:MAG: acetyl-CoA C-acetyltransferase [Myxococcota bacterium]